MHHGVFWILASIRAQATESAQMVSQKRMTGKPSISWTQFVTAAALLLPSDTAFSHQCGVASCLQQACRILDAVRTFSAEQEIHWGVLSDLGASRSGSGSCKCGWSWHAPEWQALHAAHPMYQQLICKLHSTVSRVFAQLASSVT